MKQFGTFAVALLLCTAATSNAQVTDGDIENAIKAGQMKKFDHLISSCIATVGFGEGLAGSLAGGIQPTGGFDVTVSASAGRIAFLSAEAKRLYKPFGIADVPESVKTPAIFVAIEPGKPSRSSNGIAVASPIDRVVFKSKSHPEMVVQPESVESEPVEWANLIGGKVTANRAIAKFSFDSVRELPPGDFDVVIITQAGERKCKVGSKDRAKLLPPIAQVSAR
jgi:hypothetical protein